MIKTLVSVDADLPSSIALRYACQLANLIGMEVQTIHVEEADDEGYSPGTGWVRRTWEQGLLETAQGEIAQLIRAERHSCPSLVPPKILVGDHETQILHELEQGAYDLFIEGVLYSFSSSNFYKKINSRLFRKAPCPFMLVSNLADLKRGLLLLEESVDFHQVISTFLRLFGKAEITLDLFYCQLQAAHEPISQEGQASETTLQAARKMLADHGLEPSESRMVDGSPKKIAESFGDYGLVASSIDPHAGKKSPFLELLSDVKSAVLLC
jgi:hypothetical protein